MIAHPLHPAVVHFPFGLLLTATIADLARLAGLGPPPLFAAWLMGAGLAAGLVAMAAGLYDLRRLSETQMTPAMRHMGAMAAGWLGYAIAFYLRRDILVGPAEPPPAALAVSAVSALVMALGGWLGGELVYRYGAGRIEP